LTLTFEPEIIESQSTAQKNRILAKILEINQYGFFGADINTNILAIANISEFLNLVFCFIIKNIMYAMLYLFSKTLKIKIYELKFFIFWQFQYFAIVFN